jgi:hypothetical protein
MIAGSNVEVAVVAEPSTSGVSWPAIVAGALASLALTLVMLTLGTGLGLAVVSPWGNEGVSGTTFHIASGVYLLAVATMASALGGYIAGRLRTKWIGVERDEVYFRDTAHGFLAWALASLVGAGLLASVAAGIVNSTVLGASQGAAAGGVAASSSGVAETYIDRLLRVETAAPASGTAPSPTPAAPAPAATGPSMEDTRAELSRLLAPGFQSGGNVNSADRTYLARFVATRTGMSQADAERRVDQVLTQAKAAADEARKAALKAALWMTAALLMGAFAASLAATEGGGLRDGTWLVRR